MFLFAVLVFVGFVRGVLCVTKTNSLFLKCRTNDRSIEETNQKRKKNAQYKNDIYENLRDCEHNFFFFESFRIFLGVCMLCLIIVCAHCLKRLNLDFSLQIGHTTDREFGQ